MYWIGAVVILAVEAKPPGAKIFRWYIIGVWIFFGVGVGWGWSGIGCSLRIAAAAAGGEHDLPRCSLALVPDHEYVVAGAIEELEEHIARPSGTVGAKDSLVGAQALDFCPSGGGDILQNLP